MKTPLNKARTPENKTLTPDTKAPSVGTLTQEAANLPEALQKVAAITATIAGETPGLRAMYLDGIRKAQEAQRNAADAKENAQTEADFDKACDDEAHAKNKEGFFRRKLEELTYTPRMDGDEYDAAVTEVKTVVENAAATFGEIAARLMVELMEAKAEYVRIATQADTILTNLDKNANVLQCRYPYTITRFTGDTPDIKKLNPSEWKRHATRYIDTGEVCHILTNYDNAPAIMEAWNAANRLERRRERNE